MQHLPDAKFYRQFTLLMVSHHYNRNTVMQMSVFSYKVALSPEQFFQVGFAPERKLILALDLYDLVKAARKTLKLESNLARTSSAPYASDVPLCRYEVLNHRKGEAVKCEFRINATLQKASVTVLQRTELPKDLIQEHRFN